MTNEQYVSPENDRSRRKDSEHDSEGVALSPTSAELLHELYTSDPDDPGPGRVNARHRW